jgi:hypothetical protein
VFIVPMMSRFAGTPAFAGLRLAGPNSSPEYGSFTLISLAAPNRLSGSINVINSPKPSWTRRRGVGAANLRDVPPVDLVNHQRVRVRRKENDRNLAGHPVVCLP